MNNKLRMLSLLLAGLFALSSLVGCADNKEDPKETTPTVDTNAVTGETAEETTSEDAVVDAALEDLKERVDWNKQDFGILYVNSISGYTEEVEAEKKPADGISSDVINDAVYSRNILFEEYCNLNFVLIPQDNGAIGTKLQAEAQSGAGDFCLVTQTTSAAAANATSNLLYDYLSLDIDYEQPWWDKGTLDFALNGKVFFMNGPFNIVDDDVTFVMMFNKQLREDCGVPNIYDTVKQNEWTMDYFNGIISSLSGENGDGTWNEMDTYGFASPGSIGNTFFYGAGLQFVKNNREMDTPELMLGESQMERALDVLTLARSIAHDNHSSYIAKAGDEALSKNIFVEGRSLFYCEAASYLRGLNASMDTEYGVIPIPKYSTDQEHYTTWSHSIGSTLSMPTSVGKLDQEMFALVLETYVVLSEKFVRPAYYDNMLTVRNVHDAESAEMVDMIFLHRVYDMAMYFDTLNLSNIFSDSVTGADNFSSAYTGASKKFDAKLRRLLQKL